MVGMYVVRKVGTKGQVVIPEQIRKEKGISEGTILYFDVEDDKIIMKKKKDDLEMFHELLKGIPEEKRHKFDMDSVFEQSYEERLGRVGRNK